MKRRLVLAFLLALLAGDEQIAVQPSQEQFAFERPITAVASGPQRLPIDAPLLVDGTPFHVIRRGSRSVAVGGLRDLRLFDRDRRAVPHMLVHPPAADPDWVAGRLLPATSRKETAGLEVDFGGRETIDAIGVEGLPVPFLRRVSVEGSGDRVRWTVLAPEATLFDLPAEKLRQIEIGFVPGAYRYIRVTWHDADGGRVPPPRVVRARRAAAVQLPPQAAIELAFERQPSEPGRSRYRVQLPAARLPIAAIELDVGGEDLFRAASVTEPRLSGFEAAPVEIGRATLSRVSRNGVEAADLRVPLSAANESELQLVIDDGNEPPLEIKRVLAVLADLPAIYFEAPSLDLVARYGDPSRRQLPQGLEDARPSIDIARVREAEWGTPRALIEAEPSTAAERAPQAGGPIDAAGFRHLRPIVDAPPGPVSLQLDAAVLARSRGPGSRFADVRLLDSADRQIPYLVERRDEPLQIDLRLAAAETEVAELRRTPGRQRSVYRIALPYSHLPPGTLVLETPARLFQRNVQLGIERPPDRSHRDAWFQRLASEAWQHSQQQTAAGSLALRLGSIDSSTLVLVVDEGDNAALPIANVFLLVPSYRLRYYQPASSALRLAYGRDDLQPPQYDLTMLAERVMGASVRHVVPAGESGDDQPRDAAAFNAHAMFWVLLAVTVVVLVGLIAKLARQ